MSHAKQFEISKRVIHCSVGRYHGTTVEPRYFFFTVPVPSRSRYYSGTAIPLRGTTVRYLPTNNHFSEDFCAIKTRWIHWKTIVGAIGDSRMGLLPSWSATDALALRCVVSATVTYCCHWIVPLHHLRNLMRQLFLTKYALRSLVQAYLHCRHSVGILQPILAGTADTVIKLLQSVQKTADRLVSGTIFLDRYHYFTQPHWLLMWRRIVSKSTIRSLPIWTLHMTG